MVKKTRVAGMGMSLLLATGGAVNAEPVLLASLSVPSPGVVVGTPEVLDWHWPVLFYVVDGQVVESSILFEDFSLPPDHPVSISDTVSVHNEPDFETFATLLTDGIDESIIIGAWDDTHGLVGGGGGPESFDLELLVPGFGPDLVGYTIDHITQILTVDIQSPGSDPFGDGSWTDWSASGRYEFYGAAIPEPDSMGLVMLICAYLWARPPGLR
jgi:hypothetical protein